MAKQAQQWPCLHCGKKIVYAGNTFADGSGVAKWVMKDGVRVYERTKTADRCPGCGRTDNLFVCTYEVLDTDLQSLIRDRRRLAVLEDAIKQIRKAMKGAAAPKSARS